MGRSKCLLGSIYRQIHSAGAIQDVVEKKRHLRRETLPLLVDLAKNTGTACNFLLNSVVDTGGMQTVIELEARTGLFGLDGAVSQLEKLWGEKLPAECYPSMSYQRKPHIIVPTVRSILEQDEPLRLKVIILDRTTARSAIIYWRPLGKGKFKAIELQHLGRAVYMATVPSPGDDFEYYIKARTAGGQELAWPACARDESNRCGLGQ